MYQSRTCTWRPALGIVPARTPSTCLTCDAQYESEPGPVALIVTSKGAAHLLCDECFGRVAPEMYSELVCDRIMAATNLSEWMLARSGIRP